MSLFESKRVVIDCSSPEYTNNSNNIADIFKQIGPNCTILSLDNAKNDNFPVETVDAYLREHPENVMNVAHLVLDFDTDNSVQLLEMVANRFPKIQQLNMNLSDLHPIEHTLTQLSRMSHLVQLNTQFSIKELYEFMQARSSAPFPKMAILYWGPSTYKSFSDDDNFDYFEATFPVLFPNLVELHIYCPSKTFTDKMEQNARKLFPKMKICEAVDCEDTLADESKKQKQKIEKR